MVKVRWFSVISTLVILTLLVIVLRKIDFYEVYLLIASTNPWWFILAVFSTFMTFIVWNIKWRYIFKPVFKGNFWFMLKVLFAGAFYTTLTPDAAISGEPFKAYYLAKKYKKPKSKVLGYVLGDKFFQLILLGIFAFFSIMFIFVYVKISPTLKYILQGVLVVIVLLSFALLFIAKRKVGFKPGVLFKRLHFIKFLKKRFKTPDDLANFINKEIKIFSRNYRKVLMKPKNLVVGFGLSIIFWMFTFLTGYFLFLAFDWKVNFLTVVIVFTLGNLMGSLSPSPGGVGVAEGSMFLLYTAIGVFPIIALLVALLNRMIYYFFSLVIGGWCLINIRNELNGKEAKFF